MQPMNASKWVGCLNEVDEAKARLVCFTYEGGSSKYYSSWVPFLRSGVELLTITLPGREDRVQEPLPQSVEEIVDGLISESATFFEKPFIVFGHGLGAILAYETVCKLARLDWLLPKRLIVSGCQAPVDDGSYFPKMSHLDDQDFFEDLVGDDCLGQEVLATPEAISGRLPVIRSDFLLKESYRPTTDQVLNIPVDVFAGSRDQIPLGNLLDWQKVSRHQVHVCVFKGGHFFIEEDQQSLLHHVNELFNEIIVSGAYA